MTRYHYLDGDYRRDPKTEVFCCRCNKDIPEPRFFVFIGDDMHHAIHPEDVATAEDKTITKEWIGPECRKHVPADFVSEKS